MTLLLSLYTMSKTYPWEPTLFDHEVICISISPMNEGEHNECWKGIFLGHYTVAMKRPRAYIEDYIARERVLYEVGIWKDLRHPTFFP